jgi:hypothetical protein
LPAESVVTADGSLAAPEAVGDQIALRWDWVCDVLIPPR